MRLISGMIGVIIVAVGTIAVATGDFAVDGGGWLLASGLATLGGAGLVATAAAAPR